MQADRHLKGLGGSRAEGLGGTQGGKHGRVGQTQFGSGKEAGTRARWQWYWPKRPETYPLCRHYYNHPMET